ncbi:MULTISPECIES: pyrophosphatase PpaX [unclassified Paenibacillus]|uniref:pyrophosphatase PpaX n=1 Tax=unclassified Paenibacillus TaxID=185978 RepID=UPI0009553D46|nr:MULTISPECIES: pyrophosphatase PpaX [unclassified Paenibacillus]ASS67854.1 pyrophosphatase PpaX [Paenibacillus sp. RUD330]SIR45891.1 pyrophosphatase PpaX [Paenibacillus sp. RU4X]SIR55348.1 pyrophosphatase PpaX [Paenibacillus sp. RU4T]
MKTPIQNLLFDLDGTILDTNELIMRSFLHALQGVVPADFGREQMIPYMGLTLVDQMKHFSGQEETSHLISLYREMNMKLHDDLVVPFPHTAEVLERLKAAGFKLGVVTTKIRMSTEKGLRLTGLLDYMDAIVTLDDVDNPKPHPEPVLRAMEMLGAKPEETMMVGDSTVDIQSALEAGAVPVGVAWSLKGEELLRQYGAAHVLQDMRDLYALLGLEQEAR